MEQDERLTREEKFEVALSLQLGIPLSRLKQELTAREYIAYQMYYTQVGFGEEANYIRSANLIVTIVQQIHGAMGGKPPELELGDIYPQLRGDDEEPSNNGNNLIKWKDTSERMRKQLVAAGLFDENGNPKGYNPHA